MNAVERFARADSLDHASDAFLEFRRECCRKTAAVMAASLDIQSDCMRQLRHLEAERKIWRSQISECRQILKNLPAWDAPAWEEHQNPIQCELAEAGLLEDTGNGLQDTECSSTADSCEGSSSSLTSLSWKSDVEPMVPSFSPPLLYEPTARSSQAADADADLSSNLTSDVERMTPHSSPRPSSPILLQTSPRKRSSISSAKLASPEGSEAGLHRDLQGETSACPRRSPSKEPAFPASPDDVRCSKSIGSLPSTLVECRKQAFASNVISRRRRLTKDATGLVAETQQQYKYKESVAVTDDPNIMKSKVTRPRWRKSVDALLTLFILLIVMLWLWHFRPVPKPVEMLL